MCRRYGVKLCQTAKCPVDRRAFPPGMHGRVKGYGKISNYGKQLAEKQKAKTIYGLRERAFRNYFEKAFASTGNTAEKLFAFLENRLDNTVYRSGIAQTRIQARQLVGHGHIRVNGKKVDIASFQVSIGDVISLSERSQKSARFAELKNMLDQRAKEAPMSWMVVDSAAGTAKLTATPKPTDVDVPVDWRMIIEFYSK